jgi:hypothetical protein
MAKKSKKNRLKLPKRVLGARIPKDSRKRINGLLKHAPASESRPIVAAAVSIVATMLAERLEGPLNELLNRHGIGEPPAKGKSRGSAMSAMVKH